MMEAAASDAHHNPFEVLELGASATVRDVSRQKEKLLGMLELGLERAKRYPSAVGDKERTADVVRAAAQELERPRTRLTWELWLKPSDEDVEADPAAAAMRRALLLHYELKREVADGIALGADEIDLLGDAWDAVLSGEGLFDRIVDRAAELELEVDESEVFDDLTNEVRGQMRTLFEQGPAFDLDALTSEIATEVAHEFADRKVEVLELAATRISKTNRQQRQQQWHGLVKEYGTAVVGRGEYFRRTAFQSVSSGLSGLAVELFNKDIDHSTALAMFRWLRDEASNLGYEDLQALHAKNALTVETRMGRDAAALHAATQSVSSSSGSSWPVGRILSVCAGLLLALARAGGGCDTHEDRPSFTVPSYQYQSPGYDNYGQRTPSAEEIQRLLESVEKTKQYHYEPGPSELSPSEPSPSEPSPSGP